MKKALTLEQQVRKRVRHELRNYDFHSESHASGIIDLVVDLTVGYETRLSRLRDLVTSSCMNTMSEDQRTREAPLIAEFIKQIEEGEISMKKYGVQVEEGKEKTGAEGHPASKCPLCGAELDSGGACPKHGTEPFERRPEEKK